MHPIRRALLRRLLAAAALTACADGSTSPPPPPTTGTLVLNVTTTGVDVASPSVVVSIDGVAVPALASTESREIVVPPGSHAISLATPAFNCDVASAPDVVVVSVGTTSTADVKVTCSPYLRDAIIYTTNDPISHLAMMRSDGSRVTRLLVPESTAEAAPAISPDGQSIVLASRSATAWDGIYLLDRFGKNRVKLVGRSDFDNAPVWSPDGSLIAFGSVTPPDDAGRIFLIKRDGTGLRQLTPDDAPGARSTSDFGVSFAPDGARLVFSRAGVLHMINVDGSGLTSLNVYGQYPAWSPDGSRIAYHSGRSVYVVDANGTNARRLTTSSDEEQMARWSPDGTYIVFLRDTPGPISHMFRIRPDGTGERQLDSGTTNPGWPSWSPIR